MMPDAEIVFVSNPFLMQAHWYEEPKSVIPDHWVTKEFGFEVFKSANEADRWLYIIVSKEKLLNATPEFLDDTVTARLTFSTLTILNKKQIPND